MIEQEAAIRWVFARTLNAPGQPSTLAQRIYRAKDVQGEPALYVTVQATGDYSVKTYAHTPLWSDVTVVVKCIGKNRPMDQLEAVMTWIRSRLHDTGGATPAGDTIGSCLWSQGIPFDPIVEDGVEYDVLVDEYTVSVLSTLVPA